MIMTEFADRFYRKMREHTKHYYTSGKYDVMPEVCQRYVIENDNGAVLAIGSLVQDILHLRERTRGDIALVDMNPEYPYELIKKALEDETSKFLPEEPQYYQTNEGLSEINRLFSELNMRCFVEQFPPLPKAIPNNSLDDVFIMSLLATPRTQNKKWYEFNKELIEAVELKLKSNGKLIVEESFGRDLLLGFWEVITGYGLKFEMEDHFMQRMSSWIVFQRSG